ncbi:cortex morphogenetic protein CmpA [Halalkalibacillus halophilus]|nr:cortex morphogenetic protein CmpA [Halalkalibacillus halophilus]
MPKWLINQFEKAFKEKDLYTIKTLNQCWFYYHRF